LEAGCQNSPTIVCFRFLHYTTPGSHGISSRAERVSFRLKMPCEPLNPRVVGSAPYAKSLFAQNGDKVAPSFIGAEVAIWVTLEQGFRDAGLANLKARSPTVHMCHPRVPVCSRFYVLRHRCKPLCQVLSWPEPEGAWCSSLFFASWFPMILAAFGWHRGSAR